MCGRPWVTISIYTADLLVIDGTLRIFVWVTINFHRWDAEIRFESHAVERVTYTFEDDRADAGQDD